MFVQAKFVKNNICKCGHPVLQDHVPIGTLYRLETSTIENGTLICGGCHEKIPIKYGIFYGGTKPWYVGPLPLAIFELDEGEAKLT